MNFTLLTIRKSNFTPSEDTFRKPNTLEEQFVIRPEVTVTINLGDRGYPRRALTLRQRDAAPGVPGWRDAGRILFAIRMYLCIPGKPDTLVQHNEVDHGVRRGRHCRAPNTTLRGALSSDLRASPGARGPHYSTRCRGTDQGKRGEISRFG